MATNYYANKMVEIPDAIDNFNFDEEFLPPAQEFGAKPGGNDTTIGLNNLTVANPQQIGGSDQTMTGGANDTIGAILGTMNNPNYSEPEP